MLYIDLDQQQHFLNNLVSHCTVSASFPPYKIEDDVPTIRSTFQLDSHDPESPFDH